MEISGETSQKAGIDSVFAKKVAGDVIVPDTVDEIPDRLFAGNRGITSVTIPGTVKRIGVRAFAGCENLQVLHLQEGLETIKGNAFVRCGLREITIPRSVLDIGEDAFWWCEQLEKVILLNPETKVKFGAFSRCKSIKELHCGIPASDKIFHMMGQPFLIQRLDAPANLDHASDSEFRRLSARCAQGDADAMNALADWFEQWSHKPDASLFYIRAANYWRYRAYRREHVEAVKWFTQFFSDHPGEHLDSILFESSDHMAGSYSHSLPGRLLNDLGFGFFDPERNYEIKQFEGAKLVEVSAFESCEDPDEDGFGAENYYDWWFLDENMQPIPEVGCVNTTLRERQGLFTAIRDKAIRILQKGKE